MSARSAGACAGVELLSAYLDGELSEVQERSVERHLAECPGCRAELDGLSAVVERLRRLQRSAPPSTLGATVARRVAVETRPRSLLERLEAALRRLPLDPATLVAFGVVVSLAVIVTAFVAGLQEADRRPDTRADPTQDFSDLEVVTLVLDGRVFDRDGALWRERGAGEPQRRVDADSREARALLDSEPHLRRLLQGTDGIVLRGPDGTVIRIDP